eukprot:TRINITY_DN5447_c0_g1_i1.p1 TRINITY_DN5447_c0_g1~~TRINITY_DN5447_c0_g1_i1.p1  ORF type:complete len:550 (-),score=59.03 TRINITY_DN5447_c0_g1_i1:247-1896(-)
MGIMRATLSVSVCALICAHLVAAEFDDSGFLDWFGEELREVTDAKLQFNAHIPEYIRGYRVQGGPGSWKMGSYTLTHVFDGFSKIHRLHFGADGVTFSSNFLNSSFWLESKRQNKVVSAMLAADTIPSQGFGPKGALDGHNDNNDIKCHKVGNTELYLSDTPVASVFEGNFSRLDHVVRPSMMGLATKGIPWKDSADVAAHICATGIMAHGKTHAPSGSFIGSVACLSPLEDLLPWDYHIVFAIDPEKPDERKVITKIKLDSGRKASYMHAMAHTENHVVLIAQPLHMSIKNVMEGKPLTGGSLVLGNETIFQVVNLGDASVREWRHPSFLYGHVQNSWEDGEDIVIDLTWYEPDSNLAFLNMFKFENLQKDKRDAFPVNKVKRYRLKNDGTVEETDILPKEPKSFWELPIVNPRLEGKKEACVVWYIQGASNAYDEDVSSWKVGPNGAYGLAKRNFCTGERLGWYAPNEYPSEVSFIPDPSSSEEDRGALVGMVFDANRNISYVHIRDAKTLQLIARADLPVRVPFPVHASWFPDDDAHVSFADELIV